MSAYIPHFYIHIYWYGFVKCLLILKKTQTEQFF